MYEFFHFERKLHFTYNKILAIRNLIMYLSKIHY